MTLERSEVPPIYALTRVNGCAADVEMLVRAGARWIQVRDKISPDAALYAELLRAREAAAGDVRLFVNDRVDLAIASGADGVHLGDSDLDPRHARLVAGARPLIIGYSTHDADEAISAAARPEVDYVAIGPVFSSPTKNVRAPLGLDVVRAVRNRVEKPIVAIGGIDSGNIADVLAAGADSAAVISALYSGGDVAENFATLLRSAESRR